MNNLEDPPLNFMKLEINEEENKKISMGQFLANKKNFSNGDIIILEHKNKIRAVAKIHNNLIKAYKVL